PSLSFTASPSVLGNCYATLGSVANRTAGLRSSLTLTGLCGDREEAGNEGGPCLHAMHADVPNLPVPIVVVDLNPAISSICRRRLLACRSATSRTHWISRDGLKRSCPW